MRTNSSTSYMVNVVTSKVLFPCHSSNARWLL